MNDLLIDIISSSNVISYRKICEKFPGSEKELSEQLKKLLNDKIISKNVVLICPKCSVTLGFVESFEDKKTINCELCDYEVDVIKENFEVFFELYKHLKIRE